MSSESQKNGKSPFYRFVFLLQKPFSFEMMLIGSAVETNEKSQVPITETDGDGNDKETVVERGTYSIGQFNLFVPFSFEGSLRY